MSTVSASAILLDIEGTVSPISFVHDVLFPYARQRIESFLRDNRDNPSVREIAARIIEEASAHAALLTLFNEVDLPAAARDAAFALMDADVKATGLKLLQGLIWEAGFRGGHLKSPLFPDVAPAIRRWIASGKKVAIYSSGSVAAQKAFFAHTTDGDLTPTLCGFFDTTTGPKRSATSYAAICKSLGQPADQILFFSDVAEETRAALEAGMQSMIVVRPGNGAIGPDIAIRRISSFDELR